MKSMFSVKTQWFNSALILFLLFIFQACSTPRERESKDYYPNGNLKKISRSNNFEYSCQEYYETGVKKHEVYSTRDKSVVKNYFEDGTLKKEDTFVPGSKAYTQELLEDK